LLTSRKQTINTNETFDFLREIVQSIPDPTEAEQSSTSAPRKPRKKAQAQGGSNMEVEVPESKPDHMPDIGTWKKDMSGGGGTGEGGRGMFDDYEDDEEDY
jgi:hypothetical protein